MQHTTLQHQGAWTFGDSQRTEWYILENKEIPGPGTHNERFSKTTNSWTMGKSARGASFIPKHTNAAIGTYNLNIEFTRPDSKAMSIGNSTRPDLPESITRDTNYKPSVRPTREQAPHYSLGYFSSRNYDNGLPGPETYDTNKPDRSVSWNTQQNFFTSADRPMPYGEQGKFPGVGKYHIEEMSKSGPHYSIGKSDYPPNEVCVDSPLIFYPIKSTIGGQGKGCSMSDKLYVNGNKQDFPAPNLYYPTQPVRKTKIYSCTSNRSEMINKETTRRPAPGDYEISGSLDRGVGFAKYPRPDDKPKKIPGPGTYNIASSPETLQGKMGWKLKKFVPDITPAGNDYQPNTSLTERRASDCLNFYANRTNFSRSITKHIGPGQYDLRTKLGCELGKMSRSLRPDIRSQTPGPGQYELPTTIGRIPKYYRNLNRKITEQGHTKFIRYDPNRTAEVRLTPSAEAEPVKKEEPKV